MKLYEERLKEREEARNRRVGKKKKDSLQRGEEG
jgi:hypothetical protein